MVQRELLLKMDRKERLRLLSAICYLADSLPRPIRSPDTRFLLRCVCWTAASREKRTKVRKRRTTGSRRTSNRKSQSGGQMKVNCRQQAPLVDEGAMATICRLMSNAIIWRCRPVFRRGGRSVRWKEGGRTGLCAGRRAVLHKHPCSASAVAHRPLPRPSPTTRQHRRHPWLIQQY